MEGFTLLNWERDLGELARVLGVDSRTARNGQPYPLAEGPHGELLDQILATTQRRGAAYEGFYRSTRPFPEYPGRFIHDRVMIRRDENALLRFDLRCGGVSVDGWVLPQQNQLFMVGAESTSGSLAFGIFNGVSATQASLIDGLLLGCALDANRTPTACALVFERVGDLTGEAAADEARFAELASLEGLAPEGSVPEARRPSGPRHRAGPARPWRRLAAAPPPRPLPVARGSRGVGPPGASWRPSAPVAASSDPGRPASSSTPWRMVGRPFGAASQAARVLIGCSSDEDQDPLHLHP